MDKFMENPALLDAAPFYFCVWLFCLPAVNSYSIVCLVYGEYPQQRFY